MANVLLVEDNREIAETVALALKLGGHHVHTAYDAEAGLLEAAHFAPHVAVLNIGLPKMNGIELARALRQMHGDSIMLIACIGQPNAERRMSAAGFDRTFRKPVDFELLLAAIKDGAPSAGVGSKSSA